jgi:6-phosphogluconolactonase
MSRDDAFAAAGETDAWAEDAAATIARAVNACIERAGECSLVLTGGRAAERIYRVWEISSGMLPRLDAVILYFGDERCVAPDHRDSNFGMVERAWPTVFAAGAKVKRMEAERPHRDAAAQDYEMGLPASTDVLLLGMGEDGHVASLFPGDAVLRESHRRVVCVVGPKAPKERMTVTPPVLQAAKSVFLLVTGAEKGRVLKQASNPGKVEELPVRLVLPQAIVLADLPAQRAFAG